MTGSSIQDQATADLGDTENTAAPGWPTAASGASMGRFLVIEELGRGGMGVVLRAYDPKLGREVALKLLRSDRMDENARARLVREAQAMAKLSHPNVVAVFDVEEAPSVVLVMEYVPGPTLRRWLDAGARTPAEVLDALVQAGRGLAAAHAEGLLHRDFKPANVLVGADGRVRVTDFGLARAAGTDEGNDSWGDASASRNAWRSLPSTLTQTGHLLGTPRYMAPEQHEEGALTAAVDQYAWCVTAWEALTGSPPFRSDAHEVLRREKSQGPPPWPRELATFSALEAVLRRGLAPAAAERFPSMDALLLTLEVATRPRRRGRGALWGAGLGLTVLAGVFAWQQSGARRCTGAPEQLADAWGDERRAAVAAALAGSDVPYAAATWERLAPRLDAYASAWIEQHTETCEASTVRGEQSAEAMDLRMSCLHRAKLGLRAVVDVLAKPDATVLTNSHAMVAGLEPLARCEDVAGLRSPVPPPTATQADAVEAVRVGLAEVQALERAGRYDAALARLDELAAAIDALGYEPLRPEHGRALGKVQDGLGRYDEAAATLARALEQALAWGLRQEAQAAAAALAVVVGERQDHADEGLRLAAVARGLLGREPDPLAEARLRLLVANLRGERGDYDAAEAELRALVEEWAQLGDEGRFDLARVHLGLGNLLSTRGRMAEAEAEHRAAVALWVALAGPEHPNVALARNNVATSLSRQGKLAEAEAEHREVLALRRALLPDDHPDIADSHNNIGTTLARQGRYAEAEVEFRRTLELRMRMSVSDDISVASAHGNLGNVLGVLGRRAEAEAEQRLSLGIIERSRGRSHPSLGPGFINLGVLLSEQGRYAEAETEIRRGLQVLMGSVDATHPDLGHAHANLGEALLLQGRHAEAEIELRTALDILAVTFAPDHPSVVLSRALLGEALLALDRPDEVRTLLDGATTSTGRAAVQAKAEFTLARALWKLGERTRARSLAEAAHRGFLADEIEHSSVIAEIAAWQAAHVDDPPRARVTRRPAAP